MSFKAFVAHNPPCGEPSINGHIITIDCGKYYNRLAKRFNDRNGMFIAEIVDEEIIAIYADMFGTRIAELSIYDMSINNAWQSLIELACQKSGILLDL